MYVTKKISKAGKEYLAICYGDLVISVNLVHICLVTGKTYKDLWNIQVGEKIRIA